MGILRKDGENPLTIVKVRREAIYPLILVVGAIMVDKNNTPGR